MLSCAPVLCLQMSEALNVLKEMVRYGMKVQEDYRELLDTQGTAIKVSVSLITTLEDPNLGTALRSRPADSVQFALSSVTAAARQYRQCAEKTRNKLAGKLWMRDHEIQW